MEKTWDIQRLRKPAGDSSSSFGGGLRNGGLSDKAMELISDIWTFDYMGNSVFEWGAVAEALSKIEDYCMKKKGFADYIPLAKNVFYLCEKGEEYEVKKTITDIAMGKKRLREKTFLKQVLEGRRDYDERYRGWLELDNGFMFFTDKEMYEKTLDFFGFKKQVWLL